MKVYKVCIPVPTKEGVLGFRSWDWISECHWHQGYKGSVLCDNILLTRRIE